DLSVTGRDVEESLSEAPPPPACPASLTRTRRGTDLRMQPLESDLREAGAPLQPPVAGDSVRFPRQQLCALTHKPPRTGGVPEEAAAAAPACVRKSCSGENECAASPLCSSSKLSSPLLQHASSGCALRSFLSDLRRVVAACWTAHSVPCLGAHARRARTCIGLQ
ncbi:unnamed protein product, partial [Pleuronectes platessa]